MIMKTVTRFRARPVVATALAVVSLVLAACSSGDDAPAGEVAPETEEADLPTEPFIPGLDLIELSTALSGVGEKPLFEWQPISGADGYMLLVFAEEGGVYWSWEGEATSVYLGGGDTPPPPDAPGPILFGDMAWSVAAFDASGDLVAASPVRPISP